MTSDYIQRPSKNRQGVVLFMVVAIILMLTLLTYGFLISMRNQNLAAAQSGDFLQARQAAFSARELVCYVLESSLEKRFQMGGLESNPDLFRRIKLELDEKENIELNSSGFVVANSDAQVFGVENESAKINLGTLLVRDSEIPGWGRQSLMQIPGMDETLADHILDWIDEDEAPREFGAESNFYLENGMTPPRNSIPPTLGELALIPGIEESTIWGREPTGNSEPSDGRFESRQAQDSEFAFGGWSKFLTVYSAERNETFEGDSRIHLNDRDLAGLHRRLSELSGVEVANYVILVRQYGFQNDSSENSGSRGGSQVSAGQIQIDFTLSPTYDIENRLDLFNSVVAIGESDEDEEEVTYVQSPISPTSNSFGDLEIGFLDGTSTLATKILSGRVNLNLAPRQVLMSVPGIDESLADRIVSNRETQKNTAKTCFWLLETGLTNMETMRRIEPMVTNRGEVCQFLCGGRSDSRSAPLVFEVKVDATQRNTKQLHCRRILDTYSISNKLPSAETTR